MTAPSDHAAEAHRRRIADLVQSMDKSGKNPLYVWLAIDRCIEAGIPFPDWVLAYLKRSAGRLRGMMFGATPAGCGDVAREAEAVGKALGFGAKGRGRGSVFSQRAKGWRDIFILLTVLERLRLGEEIGERLYADVAQELGRWKRNEFRSTPGVVKKIFGEHRRKQTKLFVDCANAINRPV